eukprot:1732721-Lingulodinium_polyedra.AAC.1
MSVGQMDNQPRHTGRQLAGTHQRRRCRNMHSTSPPSILQGTPTSATEASTRRPAPGATPTG